MDLALKEPLLPALTMSNSLVNRSSFAALLLPTTLDLSCAWLPLGIATFKIQFGFALSVFCR